MKAALLLQLDQEIEAAVAAAKTAQETASHEDNKPENQYDTLSLEAAYLAHGQSERIHELQQTRIHINQWPVPDFTEDDLIANGALIQLEHSQQGEKWIWITPIGGRQLELDRNTILVLSIQAPLAHQLMQLGVGDELSLSMGNTTHTDDDAWEIIAIA